jgi:16S rRNA (guanine966-N2)-methyltransferase
MYLEVLEAIEGAVVLDLFAGSGALGLEALSRGAKSATFVESATACTKIILKNIEKLHYTSSTNVCARDVLRYLHTASQLAAFDLVFIDPPYAVSDEVVHEVLEKLEQLLKRNAVVVLERSKSSKLLSPEPYELLRTRTYGDSAVHFLSVAYSEPHL